MLGLPGSAYLYQGQELGLEEVVDLPAEARQDPAFRRTGGAEGFRDGCRVPMPWTREGASFGFSPTGASWLPMPAHWGAISVEAQTGDPDSTLELTRRMLRLRRAEPALGDGDLHWVSDPGDTCLVLRRPAGDEDPHVLVAMNLGEHPALVPATRGPRLERPGARSRRGRVLAGPGHGRLAALTRDRAGGGPGYIRPIRGATITLTIIATG